MTVPLNDFQVGPVVLAAGARSFSLDFPIPDAANIEVLRGRTTLVEGTAYTVTGDGVMNPVIVRLTAPADGTSTYTARYREPLQRPTDFPFGGRMRSDVFNAELDRVWRRLIYDANVATALAATVRTEEQIRALIDDEVARLVGAAPDELDTLEEIADALNNDENLAATLMAEIALKAPIASPTFTGNPTAPNPPAGDSDNSLATTSWVMDRVNASAATRLALAGGTLAGNLRVRGSLQVDGGVQGGDAATDPFAVSGTVLKINAGDETRSGPVANRFSVLQFIRDASSRAFLQFDEGEDRFEMRSFAGGVSRSIDLDLGGGSIIADGSELTGITASQIPSSIARLADPTFTGTVSGPTPPADSDTTVYATTAWVRVLVAGIEAGLDQDAVDRRIEAEVDKDFVDALGVDYESLSNLPTIPDAGLDQDAVDRRIEAEVDKDFVDALGVDYQSLSNLPTIPDAGLTSQQVTAIVNTRIGQLTDGAPAALDTLNELAAALGDDADFAATVTASLAGKAPLASPALTGAVTVDGTMEIRQVSGDQGDLTVRGDLEVDGMARFLGNVVAGNDASDQLNVFEPYLSVNYRNFGQANPEDETRIGGIEVHTSGSTRVGRLDFDGRTATVGTGRGGIDSVGGWWEIRTRDPVLTGEPSFSFAGVQAHGF